jgi:hypothetical protein
MADTPGKRVAVLDPDGNFGTLPEEEIDQLPDGARVLTKQQLAEKAVEDRYAALPTGRKVLGGIAAATGVLNPLLAGASPDAPPTVAAYGEGVREGRTGGLFQAGSRKLADAVGGKAAGNAYAEQIDQQEAASPWAKVLGNVAGFVGGTALGAGGGAPGVIGALGGLAEQGTERALARVAAQGALGRAATTAAGLGVRSALEGGAYGALGEYTQSVLHDTPETGEKMYAAIGHGALMGGALGTTLGFGGSLAASGTRNLLAKLVQGSNDAGAALEEGSQALRKGTATAKAALEEGVAGAKANVDQAVSDAKAQATQAAVGPAETASNIARRASSTGNLLDTAHEYAWDAIGKGNGLQTTRFVKSLAKVGGKQAVGETMFRYGLVDMGPDVSAGPATAAMHAGLHGTAADILPKADAAVEHVGQRLGEITAASGARIPAGEISDAFGRVRAEPASKALHEHVVRAIDDAHMSILSHLPIAEDGTVAVQDVLKQRKALDDIVWKETKTLDPNQRVEALRDVRAEIEDLVSDALDKASGKVPGALRDQYESLKGDYGRLRLIQDTAADSAARQSKAGFFGLREMFAAGSAAAGGHFLAAPVLAVGGKIVKERGQAAAAAFLKRAAEQGTFTRLLDQFDAKVASAAKGSLRDGPDKATIRVPKRATAGGGTPDDAEAGRAATRETQAKAGAIVKWMGETKADPTKLMDELDAASSVIGRSAGPNAAQSYSGATLRAVNFISSYIPVKERRDPLDPRSVPPLTFDEADRLVRAATYATKPATVWDDFERGKVTPEGIAAAKAFMADSFATFQGHLMDHVEEQMIRNVRMSDSQRLRISKLLGYPASPEQKPAALARLQGNFAPSPQGQSAGPTTQPNGPVNMKVSQSGFDSVEARFSS